MRQTIHCVSMIVMLAMATMVSANGQDPQPVSSGAGIAQSETQSSSITVTVQQAIIDQTNEFRQSNGLASVQPDEHLTQAANDFAEFKARTGKYGHRADGATPAQRAEAAGYDYCVVRENIAYRTNSGEVTADSLIEVFVEGSFSIEADQ